MTKQEMTKLLEEKVTSIEQKRYIVSESDVTLAFKHGAYLLLDLLAEALDIAYRSCEVSERGKGPCDHCDLIQKIKEM